VFAALNSSKQHTAIHSHNINVLIFLAAHSYQIARVYWP